MVERKTPFRGKREYVTFGDGFPGFGETDELKASRWNADLFEEAPVSEPENAPVAYTGDEDFSTRGRYSGVGVIVDEGADFDPEPALCGSSVATKTVGGLALASRENSAAASVASQVSALCERPASAPIRSPKPAATTDEPSSTVPCGNFKPAEIACDSGSSAPEPDSCPKSTASARNPEPSTSGDAKFDLSLFRELYRSRDGRLVFFEHRATGHLAAVDASKLA